MVGESDLTLGNEPLRFRNVSEDVLASEKPPGGLEDVCLRSPKRVMMIVLFIVLARNKLRIPLEGTYSGEM